MGDEAKTLSVDEGTVHLYMSSGPAPLRTLSTFACSFGRFPFTVCPRIAWVEEWRNKVEGKEGVERTFTNPPPKTRTHTYICMQN